MQIYTEIPIHLSPSYGQNIAVDILILKILNKKTWTFPYNLYFPFTFCTNFCFQMSDIHSWRHLGAYSLPETSMRPSPVTLKDIFVARDLHESLPGDT